ncbi:MAG: quinolinate synthase NadA [Coriobacteriales bacterium]|nr:quinolinate synthase NadA [Coriobacteriales bacterium]
MAALGPPSTCYPSRTTCEGAPVTDHDALSREIRELAKERDAIILAHTYQRAEVQDVADLVGDSLGLAREAAATDASVIVFAGVHFMAETAKILAPDRTVLLPEPRAGCPMADMLTADQLRAWKAEYPGVPVVTYVNSTAEVKAESDVCVTSANAVAVVRSLDTQKILFAPDRNLGHWIARSLPDVEVVLWDGWCPTHEQVTPEQVREARGAHPDAVVLAHPECRPEVVDLADHVLSTSQMIRHVASSDAPEFVIVTETGIVHGLQKAAPGKAFHELAPRMICPNMKLTTLEKVRASLAEGLGEIDVDEVIATRARAAVERMVAIG